MHIESHYLPSIEYVSLLLKSDEIVFESFENFQKQTYRNRCKILTSNGVESLVIPVKHVKGQKVLMKDVQIDFEQNWQKQHLGAIQAAYGKSAYFEYIFPLFSQVYEKKSKYLLDLNIELLKVIFKILGKSFHFNLSSDFIAQSSNVYNLIHPKQEIIRSEYRYRQCFGTEFVCGLSVLDLIMNEGRESNQILTTLQIEQF